MDRTATRRSNNRRVTIDRNIYYDALPSQKAFHDCDARFKGFSGPIGSGKSQALCHEAIRLSYRNPGRQGLLAAPTFPMLRDATQRSLFELLEHNRIPTSFNKADNCLTMQDTNSKILFRSLEDFERLRGTNLAWFGVDELTYCKEEAWLRLEGRLRDPKATQLSGFGVWTPKGFDWVYRRFLANPISGYKAILAQPRENRHLLETIPDFYDRLKDSYDERFYQQEVLGAYLNISAGQAYYSFERGENVRPCPFDPKRALYWAMDFNVDPMSSVVVQVFGDTIHVIDEIALSRATTWEACEEFLRRYPECHGLTIFGDASGNSMKTTGPRDADAISTFFRTRNIRGCRVELPPQNPAVRERIVLMNSTLKDASGKRRLYLDPRCTELIKDLEQVTLLPGTMIIDKHQDPKRTHLSDALGYLLWQVVSNDNRQAAGFKTNRLPGF
jgi:hypothetical protein